MTVLRRLDALLEPAKEAVMEELAFQREEAGFTEWDENGLRTASGFVFYNISEWTLQRLHSTASNNQDILLANFEDYLNGFSANVKEIIDKFKLRSQVRHMAHKDILLDVIEKFTSPSMLEHFMKNVVQPKKLKGKAKGMVVTQSIESAIKYFKAIRSLLDETGKPFRAMVAFSGEKILDGIKYTEENINDLPAHLDTAKPSDPGYISDKLARFFDMDGFRLLVVANKYLTGFDQPKLSAMYVDKKLQGVLAVQALSRLNRAADKYGKRTEDIFILDFFNSTSDIKNAFDPFYTATTLSGATDINVLHELKEQLDAVGVYEGLEVETFAERYFDRANSEQLSPLLGIAEDRFNHSLGLEDNDKADFKIKAKQFVKIYGQASSIMPFEVVVWEKLFWFLKFLIPSLVVKESDSLTDELLESVDLSTYGLERTQLSASIGLDSSETEFDPQNPNPRGAHGTEQEIDPLDQIIQNFNERWFHGWDETPEMQRVKFISWVQKMKAHPDFQSKYAGNQDEQNREIAFKKIFDEVMADQRKNELDLYRMLSKDDAFKAAMQDTIKRMLRAS